MSIAMLWLNPRVKPGQLGNIHHKKLGNLVEAELARKGFVGLSFYDTYIKLRELRERCSYQFGYWEELGSILQKAINDTDASFTDAFHFVHQVLKAGNCHFRVQVDIADGFGDDILDSYLTKKSIKKKVFNYSVRNGVSA